MRLEQARRADVRSTRRSRVLQILDAEADWCAEPRAAFDVGGEERDHAIGKVRTQR